MEIQNHDLPEEKTVREELHKLAKKHNIKLVATNDLHYIHRSDASGQDILLCIQTNANYLDPTRMRFNNDSYYLRKWSSCFLRTRKLWIIPWKLRSGVI